MMPCDKKLRHSAVFGLVLRYLNFEVVAERVLSMIVQYGKKASLFLICTGMVACNGAAIDNQQDEIEQHQAHKKEKSWWAALPFVVPPVVLLGYRFFGSYDGDAPDEPPKQETVDDGAGLGGEEVDQSNVPPSSEEQEPIDGPKDELLPKDKLPENGRNLPWPTSLRSDRRAVERPAALLLPPKGRQLTPTDMLSGPGILSNVLPNGAVGDSSGLLQHDIDKTEAVVSDSLHRRDHFVDNKDDEKSLGSRANAPDDGTLYFSDVVGNTRIKALHEKSDKYYTLCKVKNSPGRWCQWFSYPFLDEGGVFVYIQRDWLGDDETTTPIDGSRFDLEKLERWPLANQEAILKLYQEDDNKSSVSHKR